MAKDNRFCLGVVVGVHGIKGEVKVKSFTAVDTDLDRYGDVEDKSGNNRYHIKVTGHSKELLRVKIKGIDDRNAAERLKGTEFYVSKDVLPELAEDEYYLEDLVGLKVRLSPEGSDVGEIVGVYNFGAGDVLEVKELATGKRNMLPFTKAFVPDVNTKEGYIIVEAVQLNLVDAKDANIDAD